ncbi:Ger(x)C family spore germination protein [Paenibacillus sp. NPDC056579]|uniref:Ger(x)C family spore germination protein n=1 Tax=Paenibacillus sp. NPDC056579 TaxID=3345871 RepID=UPI0036C5721E
MKRAGKLCFVVLLSVSSLTGCWDLREPNQLAFITGAALDITSDGQVEVSSQIAIPAVIGGGQEANGGGENKKSFYVASAKGKNIMDAGQILQTKLSRQLFYGHRQVILIGQTMAEYGIGRFIDMFIRNPQSELRSTIYVVKDGQAKDILSMQPIFDPYTAMALVNEQASLHMKAYYYRDFLSDALSQGTHPLLPAVSLTPSKKYVYTGTAVLNKDNGLKLVGFLNTNESYYVNWITDRLKGFTITSSVKKGNGNVSLQLQSLSRRIKLKTVEDRMQMEVSLTGKGMIVENNSSLDPAIPKDLRVIEDELGKEAQQSVEQLVANAQKQYKLDIFGFGEVIHQQYPRLWISMKEEWNKMFPELPISVKVELQCKDPGQTTSSVKVLP